MEWGAISHPFDLSLSQAEKNLFELEYVFARNFQIGRHELEDMPYAEVVYWIEQLRRENAELERRATNAR
jgi:hypothetical protein